MKKLIYSFLISVIMFSTVSSFTGDDFGVGLNRKDKPFMKEVKKTRISMKGDVFSLNLDIQLGVSIANTKFEFNQSDTSTARYNNSGTKVGPAIGAILSFNFLGFGFTTGIQYSSKGLKTTNDESIGVNYFNIPMLIYFDFNVGKKVIIDGNVGPYFGLRVSQDQQSLYTIKNFDFGLTGNIQGAYMFQKHLGALLGLKYEYGGLNNLGNNQAIDKITSQTYYIYTGLKIIL